MVRDALRDRSEGVPVPPTPTFTRMLGRALLLRCCVCGSSHIFTRYTRMVERCPRCGYLFERIEGQYIGAVGMNTIVTFGLMLVALVAGLVITAPDIATVPLLVITLAIGGIVPVLFYPFSKTVWTAVDLRMNALEPGEAPNLSAGTPSLTG